MIVLLFSYIHEKVLLVTTVDVLMFNDLNALDICDAVSTVDDNKCLYVAVRVLALFISSVKYTCLAYCKRWGDFKSVKG